jgi:RHS repeat-associated protein
MTEYTYDYRNRLTRVVSMDASEKVTGEEDYTYDVNNNRIAKSVAPDGSGSQVPTITRSVYHGSNIAIQFNGSGAVTHHYLYGPAVDQVLADEDAAGNVHWMLVDKQGSIRDIIDSTGAILDHIVYDSFGRISSETNPAMASIFAYIGRELDRETGLQYDRARYYDPGTGRFISQDPLSFRAGDVNLYRYSSNSPTNEKDPSGLTPWYKNPWIVGGIVVGAIGIGIGIAVFTGGFGLFAEAEVLAEFSLYEDITIGNSVRNIATNVVEDAFIENLEASGFTATTSQDGLVTILERDGVQYVVRGFSNQGSATADYYGLGDEILLKIRLGQ